MTAPHLDPTRKIDFVFLLEARDSNPNGDPDAGGMPRTDPVSGQGLITDVALKRKIRNTVSLLNEEDKKPGYDIYVEAGIALNAQHERAYAADALGGEASQLDAQQWMCRTFFDVRMFGAVMTTGKKDRQAGRVRGPLQLTFSRSIDPVTPLEYGITRVTPTKQEDINAGKVTEMGSKHIVPYGLYRGEGHFSAPLAARTGVTTDDLTMFWRAFTLMFDHDRAAARGELNLRGLYVFTHDDPYGKAPARQLLDRITVKGPGDATARTFHDYHVAVDETELPQGVTLTTLIG
ncbi:type I-C CRISPR-associated protein Cas7/Csd2 [Streptomyces sp. SID8361]|uniref:type I-C CRISPR-associated protein Cas7/Csd2 n=1 Tax=Streptomyces sp. MnatMP-M27 TaxID=1839768 RepID=UPI00081DC31E|nr:type I-C CRISPR-associated protein Cas7/Csd2 [Streptomyces sp. MnatMP-M27]MYU09148.1 type I-C CRISPR-associated protein Cas7/Csd2 [Streptomyces sp. SID8361]SCF59302.1 CRISPR-associated protein, Csd2 family [Streptomyces sp. MnatMP-M27]